MSRAPDLQRDGPTTVISVEELDEIVQQLTGRGLKTSWQPPGQRPEILDRRDEPLPPAPVIEELSLAEDDLLLEPEPAPCALSPVERAMASGSLSRPRKPLRWWRRLTMWLGRSLRG